MKKLLFIFSMVLISYATAFAQREVTGTVTDSGDVPLIGASVLVKGTSIGTVTDLDGNFSIKVPEGNGTLVVSYTGFETNEVVLGASNIINVKMSEGSLMISEVVVTGTGVATDRRRTAISVEAIPADELPTVSSGSVDQALVGKIPGAYIQQNSGQPGQQANILLRGINSLGGTTPMILIDGVQVSTDNNFNGGDNTITSRLADIDFSNVERIEVVQGAAAATIYGAQGANGVIQIFTKKGTKGKPRINFSSNYSVGNPLRGDFEYAELHAYQTLPDGRITSGGGEPLAQDEFGVWSAPLLESDADAATDNPYVEPTYDLFDDIFRDNIPNYRTSLSVSGGSDRLTYSVTGTFNEQASAIRGRNQRFNFGTRIGFELFENFDVNIGTNIIRGDNNTGAITGEDNVFSALGAVATTFPFINFNYRDSNGNLVANPAGDNSVNPFFTETYRRRNTELVRILPNINLNWEVTDFLTLDYKYGIDYYRDDYEEFIDNQTQILGASSQGGITPIVGEIDQRLRRGTLQNSIASAFLNFGNDEGIKSTSQIAFDWRKRNFSFNRLTGTGLPLYTPVTIRAAEESAIDEFQEEFTTYGFLVNERLEYQGKIGVSGGVRVDWSSAFGEGSDPFVFPRGDIYVRLSEFDFWSMKSAIPEFKVRAAYGQAGVQPGAFDRIRTLVAGQYGSSGYLAPQVDQTNPLLDVQVSKEFEAGIDASFTPGQGDFFSFIGFSLTYWDRTSEDVIREIGVAPTTGAQTILDNAITLESNGWQVSLDKSIYQSKNFTWNWRTNFSRQQTTLASISNGVDIPVDDNFILTPGEKLGTFRGQRVLTALDETREDGTPYLEDPSLYEIVPETGYVVNKETRAVALTDDVVNVGNGLPDFNMSFINDFTIGKALSVGFQLDWVQGFDIYNQTRQWGYRDNLHGDVDNPVTIGGQTSAFLNYYRSIYNTNQANSAFVEDGSFLRLRNARIAFDFAQVFDVKGFNRLQLELSGFNLLTFTDYTGFDPEAASNTNDPTRIGLDQYAFPNSRIYQIGVNIGFQ